MKEKDLDLLTLKEVVDVFAEFDLRHTDFPHNYKDDKKIPKYNGLTILEKKLIYLDKDIPDIIDRRKAVIHEVLHSKYFLQGKKDTERQVEKETEEIYKKIYG
ncbi:MAG: hypothetical protein PHQ66_01520 [Candidatus Nanoarchaeia archaeon]|nr:hypothetical protein [Candidatus Nanoarchaeia archaeon]MDD5357945.1 hypothetical protein [Candidatus Nanoarchaeia archaeon]MDD5588864.1 hypothetical protein [Candidatus Nanoarchaeia archaeon]